MKKLLKPALFLLSITATHPIGAFLPTCQSQAGHYVAQVGKYLDLMQSDLDKIEPDKKEQNLKEQEGYIETALGKLEDCLSGLPLLPSPSIHLLPCQQAVDDYLTDLSLYLDYVGAADEEFLWDEDSEGKFSSLTEEARLGWENVKSCFRNHDISLTDQDKRLLLDEPFEKIKISSNTTKREARQ